MANTKFYIPLSTPAAAAQKSGSRRPPLTPSTVSSPCLNTHAPIATRRDSGAGSPTKASLLLAKVASSPPTPRRESAGSNPHSPTTNTSEMLPSPLYAPHDQRPGIWRSESARYYSHEKQDGYISFPDFEKFCQTSHPYDGQRQQVQT